MFIFEGETLKESNKEWFFLQYMVYNFLSFFNKSLLTFVCNSYPEKESSKIKKITKKTSNFI